MSLQFTQWKLHNNCELIGISVPPQASHSYSYVMYISLQLSFCFYTPPHCTSSVMRQEWTGHTRPCRALVKYFCASETGGPPNKKGEFFVNPLDLGLKVCTSITSCFISNPWWWYIETKQIQDRNCIIVQIHLDLIVFVIPLKCCYSSGTASRDIGRTEK